MKALRVSETSAAVYHTTRCSILGEPIRRFICRLAVGPAQPSHQSVSGWGNAVLTSH